MAENVELWKRECKHLNQDSHVLQTVFQSHCDSAAICTTTAMSVQNQFLCVFSNC